MKAWLRVHAHALADALRRFGAQPVAAAFSVVVLAVAISLPVLAAVALQSVGALASGVEIEPHANVYLALDANAEDVRRVGDALRSHPQAASVTFVPRERALAELGAATHLGELLASLDRNPLPHAYTVRLRSREPARVAEARDAWSRLPKVDQIVADFEWSERLARWVSFGDRLLGVVAAFLGAAVAFIVGHLIRLQVVSRRQEIEVSRLVGATAYDVRRPFLYHGLVQGSLAGAVAIALSWGAALWAGHELQVLAPNYAIDFKLVFLPTAVWLGVILGAATLGLAGAWWAVGRELRQITPSR